MVCNPLRPLEQDLDRYGYPRIGDRNMALIAHDSLRRGDPQLRSIIYELSASRGCPFSCTYCSSVNLRRCYQGLGRYVRFRSVDSVMNELLAAKKAMPGLRVIHFWDEIFSDEPGWVERFCQRYKREIGLPFRIWGHPLKVNAALISTMVDAGLYQVVMGIQSGSYRVRHEIFHRPESNEQVEQAAAVLADCRVPHVVYDFMLLHPFEREDDLRETFRMCLRLKPPFSLNIHGLNFLPETDIVQMAMDERIYTREQLDRMMYTGLQEQYDRYWGAHASDYGQASTETYGYR